MGNLGARRATEIFQIYPNGKNFVKKLSELEQ